MFECFLDDIHSTVVTILSQMLRLLKTNFEENMRTSNLWLCNGQCFIIFSIMRTIGLLCICERSEVKEGVREHSITRATNFDEAMKNSSF
jgi:hypothetical protein